MASAQRTRTPASRCKARYSGATARFTRNPGLPDSEELGNNDLVTLSPSDVVRLEGNGGYGDAMLRDPAAQESQARGRERPVRRLLRLQREPGGARAPVDARAL
jgi:N-methylhydantoinase B